MKTMAICLAAALTACGEARGPETQLAENIQEVQPENKEDMGFYNFTVRTLEGDTFSFESLRGKRVLIVNTASECGYTPQYAQLQELYDLYGNEAFTIIGFPANNFGGQEPGSHEEIRAFCSKNYGVTFPMMEKISVVGEDQHELYQWLTQAGKNGVSDAEVQWNFHKFLIDENGKWIASHVSAVTPLDDEITRFAAGKK